MQNNIIRVGGGCKNPSLEKYKISNYRYFLPDELHSSIIKERANKQFIEESIVGHSALLQSLDKIPLSYNALKKVESVRVLEQILCNPKISENDSLNIWLTCYKHGSNEITPVNIDALRNLIRISQFEQVPCVHALTVTQNNVQKAFSHLQLYRNHPKLYQIGPDVKNTPSISDINDLVHHFGCSEQIAIFALQQAENNFQVAKKWISEGTSKVI